MDRVEIRPASVGQVHRTRKGRLVAVDDDVQNVARDLREIDPGLKLEYDPQQDFFIVKHERLLPDGSVEEHLITTAQELDQRIVQRVREISQPGYDYAKEIERVEAEARRARDRELSEQIGPHSERLRHALRKDLGLDQDRISVPRGVE